MNNKSTNIHYHIMLLPGMIFLLIFSIVPMFGIIIAFEKFIPAKGIFKSRWVGLDNIIYMFQIPDSRQVFLNTIVIAVLKITAGMIVPVIFALLLNEVKLHWYKRSVQTIVYLPHFISWVVLSGMVINIFSYDGAVNMLLGLAGIEPTMFLASNTWFRPILIITDVWKESGFSAIIYLAAITGINENLYEASKMDGATRMQQIVYITIPCIASTIVLLATLSLGSVLNAGFDQIFNLYNPLVYQTADIIDTYVYRMGLIQMQYGLATAVGLLKSVTSVLLIIASYKMADKYANYKIF